MSDAVSPSHYQQGEIETIDAIRAALGKEGFESYCAGNCLHRVALPVQERPRGPAQGQRLPELVN